MVELELRFHVIPSRTVLQLGKSYPATLSMLYPAHRGGGVDSTVFDISDSASHIDVTICVSYYLRQRWHVLSARFRCLSVTSRIQKVVDELL